MNVYEVEVLDKNNNTCYFIEAAKSADEASHIMDKKLNENFFFKCMGPWMHVETRRTV